MKQTNFLLPFLCNYCTLFCRCPATILSSSDPICTEVEYLEYIFYDAAEIGDVYSINKFHISPEKDLYGVGGKLSNVI